VSHHARKGSATRPFGCPFCNLEVSKSSSGAKARKLGSTFGKEEQYGICGHILK
jgi:hypothetical protein